jgi:hypothetical protein
MQSQVLLMLHIVSDFSPFICSIQSAGLIACKQVPVLDAAIRRLVGPSGKCTEAENFQETATLQLAQQYEEPTSIDPYLSRLKRREWQETVLDTTFHRLADFTTSKILRSEANGHALYFNSVILYATCGPRLKPKPISN